MFRGDGEGTVLVYGSAAARKRAGPGEWHMGCIAFEGTRLRIQNMSRIETVPFPSQDDLPPEILRRLQVEELWARRNVLADLMNEERLQLYVQRYSKLADPVHAGPGNRLARLAATVVPMRSRKFPVPFPRTG